MGIKLITSRKTLLSIFVFTSNSTLPEVMIEVMKAIRCKA